MEKQFKQDYDGQAIIQGDLNLLGEVSGLADDRVLAELLRLTPYNGSSASRGILPYSHTLSGSTGLVVPNGASGSVLVSPFRAVIGSRTAVGTDAQKNWRDIRSALLVAEGDTSLTKTVSFSANASGDPRWDLIYAQVTIDTNGPTTSRYVKDPSTGSVAGQTISQYSRTTVVLGVTAGTAAASPTWPSAPSDAGSVYYIPIAYIRIPNGFSASSTVGVQDIGTVAPCLNVARTNGLQPADSLYTAGSDALTTARIQAWGASGNRPEFFAPSSMVGATDLLVVLDATTGSLSHADGSIVDSRDWRGRLVQWMAAVGPSVGSGFHVAWNSPGSNNTVPSRNASIGSFIGMNFISPASLNFIACGMSATVGNTNPLIAKLFEAGGLAPMAAGSTITLKCDANGKMIVNYTNDPNCTVVFWLRFSSVIDGYSAS